MRLKTLSGIMLTLLLIGMLTLTFKIQPAKAGGTIYIRVDGTIDPSTANITSVDNVTYILTDNINDSIVVERSNIIIDGEGYTVQGTGSGSGISLSGRSNVTIKNTNIKDFRIGIYLNSASFNVISGNNITNNYPVYRNCIGIYLRDSSNNNISENNITNNDDSIMIDWSSNNNISENNITNNGHGIYLYDSKYNSISGNNITNNNYYGIWLKDCSNNNISENNITNNNRGLKLYESSNNSIYGNNIAANNYYGIWIEYSSNNTFRGNSMTDNTYNFGIWSTSLLHFLNDADDSNTVDGKPIYYWINRHDSTVPSNASCVILVNCTYIIVQNLNLSDNNRQGILLVYTTNSTITKNNITANEYGIWIEYSSNNTIYHNNFVNNTEQVYGYNSTNIWDNEYPSGGNYWSDCTAVDADGDSIGDTYYVIDGNNTDRYPLMEPWPSKNTSDGDIENFFDKLVLLAPYIGLALTIILVIVATVFFVKHKKKQ